MYDFSLDRKRIILLVSGVVLAAILLFVAGLTVGLARSGESHSRAQASRPAQPQPRAQVPSPAAPVNQEATTAAAQSSPIASAASLAPRQEAATAASRLHAAHAQPKPVAARPAPSANAHHEKERGAWFLQAGAFSRESNARTLQKRLMQSGYPAEVQRRQAGSRDWYVVTVGHYASEESATNAAHRIEQRLGVHPAVRLNRQE